ncbi:MAG TPA: NAD-binding protein, partial [Candidatus Limnocylindria bacterium]|nr:NAD-binding protein [Candidatus Limnocylindria bacterium]
APVGFSLELAGKDLDLITAFADALGVPVPLAAVSRDVIGQAAGAVGGDRDFSAVAVHLRERGRAGEGSTTD